MKTAPAKGYVCLLVVESLHSNHSFIPEMHREGRRISATHIMTPLAHVHILVKNMSDQVGDDDDKKLVSCNSAAIYISRFHSLRDNEQQ